MVPVVSRSEAWRITTTAAPGGPLGEHIEFVRAANDVTMTRQFSDNHAIDVVTPIRRPGFDNDPGEFAWMHFSFTLARCESESYRENCDADYDYPYASNDLTLALKDESIHAK